MHHETIVVVVGRLETLEGKLVSVVAVWYSADTGASSRFDAAADRLPQTPSTDMHNNNNAPRFRPLAMVTLISIS